LEKKLQPRPYFLQAQYPNAEIEVWSMDEHRLGLHPRRRKEVDTVARTAVSTYQQKYQWMWLYGFVHPAEGETYWWILPCVKTSVFNRVLAEFAAFYGRGKNQRILLRLDSAGWPSP
jgi:hypothetical protein